LAIVPATLSGCAVNTQGRGQGPGPFHLIDRYESRTGIWQDRAMALKAIGDLGTPESRAYLEKQWERFKAGDDKESRCT
jgi:hypothetical protein